MLDKKYPTLQETWMFGTLLTRFKCWTILSQMNPTDHNYNNLLYAIYFNSVLKISDNISLPFWFYIQNLGVFFLPPPCVLHSLPIAFLKLIIWIYKGLVEPISWIKEQCWWNEKYLLVAFTVHGKVVKNINWKLQSMISDNLIYHRLLNFQLKNGLTVCTLHKFLIE